MSFVKVEYIACKDNIRFFHVLSELYIAWNGGHELVIGEEQKLHDQVCCIPVIGVFQMGLYAPCSN